MPVDIQETRVDLLSRYAAIPIRFKVQSVFRVVPVDGGLGGFMLVEERVDVPYVKDYDAQTAEEAGPIDWPKRFDVSTWGFFLAVDGGCTVGGATVAVDTPGVCMLEGRRDLAVLWDIRVHPDQRGRGIGSRLFQHAAGWARTKGCRWLKVETQNVNVQACRFYVRQGCELGAIHRYAYASCSSVAHEAMLLWYLRL